MDQLIVSFQRWAAGSADEDIIFFGGRQKIAGSYMRVTMGKLMVWALKLDPNLNQDMVGVIIMGGVPL